MTKDPGKNMDRRAIRNEFIAQLGQLAAAMENHGLNQPVDLIRSPNWNEQNHWPLYKIQAGKILLKAYQAGEFCDNGPLCKLLDGWSKIPDTELTDWSYIQGFESIGWQWVGDRLNKRKEKLGELNAYAYVIRLFIRELEKQNID